MKKSAPPLSSSPAGLAVSSLAGTPNPGSPFALPQEGGSFIAHADGTFEKVSGTAPYDPFAPVSSDEAQTAREAASKEV